MSTKTETRTVGDTPWHANGRALMIHDKDNIAVAVPAVNGFPIARQLQIRDLIVRAVNSHDDLVAVVEAMASFDGRNNNSHLKEMARAALAKAKP